MANKIKIKRGLAANRTTFTPDAGEMLFTTDTKQVYIGDGSTAGGVQVAIPPTYELISTAVASGVTNVDFTGLTSDYSEYVIVGSSVFGVGAGTLEIYTSSNNGSSYDTAASTYRTNRLMVDNTGAVTGASGSFGGISCGSITNSTYGHDLRITMRNSGLARPFAIDVMLNKYISTGYQDRTSGFRASTTAVNAVRLTAGANNLSGTFRLYGVKSA